MKITKKTNLNEVIKKHPELAEVFFNSGMGCCSCPMAHQETIEEGCLTHGMNKKQIDELLKKLNKQK